MDAHRKSIIHGSGQSRWRTPPLMVDKLRTLFGFGIDLAADAESAVSPIYFGPDHASPANRDALMIDWADVANLAGFLNPPFSLSEIKTLKNYRDAAVHEGNVASVAVYNAQIQALRIENWAQKAYAESLRGFTTIGVFPYAPQTEWFRSYVMGHTEDFRGWSGHAALDYWKIPHRVSFLQPDGTPAANAGVNTCVIHWGPNPGFVGPWVPSGRYWSFR